MKNLLVLIGVCLVVHVCYNNVKAHPHRSIEDTEEDATSSESESVVVGHMPTTGRDSSHARDMTSHEAKSHEDDDSSEEERDDNKSDEDGSVKFPKTESLCPDRPEEITNIEIECAREFQLWKKPKTKRDLTTTSEPLLPVQLVESHHMSSSEETMHENMQMSVHEMTTHEMTTHEMTTEEMTTTTTMTGEDETTTDMTMTSTTTTQRPTTTTTVAMRRSNNNNSGRKHKRSMKHRATEGEDRGERSCYPATCILRKLNLLDSMGQPSIEQIQMFAGNRTFDDSINFEEKAVECVKEINKAMVDATTGLPQTTDEVECVSQKVITCVNKGLTCPLTKVPQ